MSDGILLMNGKLCIEYDTSRLWQPMESAPKDGTPIYVYYDHDADLYWDIPGQRLTTYAAHCEGLDHLDDTGFCAVVFGNEYSEDLSGEGWGPHIQVPAWWFLDDGNWETAVNPICWMAIPDIPPRFKQLAEQVKESAKLVGDYVEGRGEQIDMDCLLEDLLK